MGNFKPWIDTVTTGTGKNCLNSTDFESDAQREEGFKGGTPASALRVNSGLRQANLVIVALMESILPNSTLSLTSSVNEVKTEISSKIVKDIFVSNNQIGLRYYDSGTNLITVPFATTATNLTDAPVLSTNANTINVKVGGKISSNFTVPYATKATRLAAGKGSANTPVYFDSSGNPQTVTGIAKNLAKGSTQDGSDTLTFTEDGVSKSITISSKLYVHDIRLQDNEGTSDNASVFFRLITLRSTNYTTSTIASALGNEFIPCSGYAKTSSGPLILVAIDNNNGSTSSVRCLSVNPRATSASTSAPSNWVIDVGRAVITDSVSEYII